MSCNGYDRFWSGLFDRIYNIDGNFSQLLYHIHEVLTHFILIVFYYIKVMVLCSMVAHFTMHTFYVKWMFSEKKIEFDDYFYVNKCIQQIEMPDLLLMCSQ